MDWLNIHISTLDSAEFVGSAPITRATWLCLLRYCIGQENGGRITGAAEWGDRKWQQLCRITKKEVAAVSDLWAWDNNDLIVSFYPADKEEEVKRNRTNGMRGGRPKKNQVDNQVVNPDETKWFDSAETERKGKEGKGTEASGGFSREANRTLPESLNTPEFRAAWDRWLMWWAEAHRNGRPMPSATADLHLGTCLKLGVPLAIEAIDNAIARNFREPAAPLGGAPKAPSYEAPLKYV